jgi:hypothetical protein
MWVSISLHDTSSNPVVPQGYQASIVAWPLSHSASIYPGKGEYSTRFSLENKIYNKVFFEL